jgi:hypothetical protein
MLSGEAVLAAEEVREVLEATPASVDALDVSGRMLGEAGPVDEGIRRLVRACELEPALLATRYEIARLYALVGDRAASEAFFGGPPGQPGITSLYWMNRCRVALWERDVVRARAWLDELEPLRGTGAIAPPVYGMLGTILDGGPPDALFDFVRNESARTSQTPRRRAFFGLVLAEWAAFLGRDEFALEGLESADAGLLFDITWLDRSPTLAELRRHPRFLAVHERVSRRAEQVRRALRV